MSDYINTLILNNKELFIRKILRAHLGRDLTNEDARKTTLGYFHEGSDFLIAYDNISLGRCSIDMSDYKVTFNFTPDN